MKKKKSPDPKYKEEQTLPLDKIENLLGVILEEKVPDIINAGDKERIK